MKAFFLILLMFSGLVFAKGPGSSLRKEATQSLDEYFASSGRKIRQLKWVELSLLDSARQQYLLEAEVFAQKNGRLDTSFFHCGVFSKKWNSQKWEVSMTACESLFDVMPLRR